MIKIRKRSGSRKLDTARDCLLVLARERGPGVKLPTLEEMCDQFSVSRTTLERAIDPLERQGLLRRKQGSGIYVEPAIRQRTIGIVFGGDIFSPGFSPFWQLLLQAVREEATGTEWVPRAYLDLSQGHDSVGGHLQLLEDLEADRLHGLLMIAPQVEPEDHRWLDTYPVPRVTCGGTGADWQVRFDYETFARLAADILAPSGHRTVALLGHGILAMQPQIEAALRRAGLVDVTLADWSYETWAEIIPWAGSREHCAHETARRLIADKDRAPLPDAVISTEDTMTRGLVGALREGGVEPGRDMRIVTAENKGSTVLAPFADTLDRIVFDPDAIVRTALEMLRVLMDGGTPPRNPALVAPAGAGVRR